MITARLVPCLLAVSLLGGVLVGVSTSAATAAPASTSVSTTSSAARASTPACDRFRGYKKGDTFREIRDFGPKKRYRVVTWFHANGSGSWVCAREFDRLGSSKNDEFNLRLVRDGCIDYAARKRGGELRRAFNINRCTAKPMWVRTAASTTARDATIYRMRNRIQ